LASIITAKNYDRFIIGKWIEQKEKHKISPKPLRVGGNYQIKNKYHDFFE